MALNQMLKGIKGEPARWLSGKGSPYQPQFSLCDLQSEENQPLKAAL